ncbi:MAG: hypothetical protein WBD24_07030 [Candidatus Omnitrophota bacterium]
MCYTVPLVASVVSTIVWKKKNKDPRIWRLTLMLYGASIFGVIDHLWNGELFLISENAAKDLMLGVTITAAIFIGWIFSVARERKSISI